VNGLSALLKEPASVAWRRVEDLANLTAGGIVVMETDQELRKLSEEAYDALAKVFGSNR